jgi:hypothetical protein
MITITRNAKAGINFFITGNGLRLDVVVRQPGMRGSHQAGNKGHDPLHSNRSGTVGREVHLCGGPSNEKVIFAKAY